MATVWDDLMKMLTRANPQDLLSFLLKDTCYLADITHEQKVRSITADYLCKATRNGEEIVVHVEFQRYHDTNMGRRMWEYNSVIAFLMRLPVYSFALYLCKDEHIVEPPYRLEAANGDVLHIFNYQNIFLWEVLPEELLQSGLAGLLPLLPLTKGAEQARDATVAAMIEGLRQAGKEDILALGYAFAGLVYTAETDKQWLKRRFEMFHSMLEGSWSYQEMVQKGIDQGLEKGIKQGLEKGVEQGIKQGVEQGELKAAKRFLARLVATRFPTLSSLSQTHTEYIQDINTLNAVIDKLLLVETVEQAQRALLEITSSEDSD